MFKHALFTLSRPGEIFRLPHVNTLPFHLQICKALSYSLPSWQYSPWFLHCQRSQQQSYWRYYLIRHLSQTRMKNRFPKLCPCKGRNTSQRHMYMCFSSAPILALNRAKQHTHACIYHPKERKRLIVEQTVLSTSSGSLARNISVFFSEI